MKHVIPSGPSSRNPQRPTSSGSQASAPAAYVIRPFESINDHEQCQALQNQVWGEPFAVPVNMTVAMERHGGLTLGAFDPRTQAMLGFVASMLAPAPTSPTRNGLCHYSHMAAVADGWRGRGVGTALKKAQAQAVLARGINLITWTYDPLESRNASLNIRKLGCICRLYARNVYGDMRDNLNAGIATDRFEVEWWLDDQGPQPDPRGPRAEIEIPLDFQEMKRRDLNLAKAWRMRTRLQFEQAFKEGYAVTDFAVGGNRAYYTLTKLSGGLDIMAQL
jgi:predicted GNAT superfamily acetyltransferase